MKDIIYPFLGRREDKTRKENAVRSGLSQGMRSPRFREADMYMATRLSNLDV